MISAIVLAAGRSRRMGAQKLLLPYAGKTLIAHIVDEVLKAPVVETVVVTSVQADPLRAALAGRPVTFTSNPDPEGDMLSSVRCGLKRLPAACTAVVILLGDQPTVTAELLTRMIDAHATGNRGIVVPAYEGRRGHPLLFSIRYRDEILTGYEDIGLRGLLHAHPDDVYELGVPTPSVLADVDTPEDYLRELGRSGQA